MKTRFMSPALAFVSLAVAVLALTVVTPASAHSLDEFLGRWNIAMEMRGNTIESTLVITNADGVLAATWESRRGTDELQDVAYADGKLTFKRSMSTQRGDFELDYELQVVDGKLAGKMITPMGEREFEGIREET